jgi:hypothetical protein
MQNLWIELMIAARWLKFAATCFGDEDRQYVPPARDFLRQRVARHTRNYLPMHCILEYNPALYRQLSD